MLFIPGIKKIINLFIDLTDSLLEYCAWHYGPTVRPWFYQVFQLIKYPQKAKPGNYESLSFCIDFVFLSIDKLRCQFIIPENYTTS